MADDVDGDLAQEMVFVVGQGLRRSDHDALAGVDAERVEILHVTDRDAVVVAVAHDFVFDLFPAAQRLLDEDLRGEGEGLAGHRLQFVFVLAEAGTEAAQRVGGAQDDRIADLARGGAGLFDVGRGVRLDRLDADLVQPLHEEFAVFRVDDGLYRGAEHLDAVFLEDAALVELHAAVERGLAAEREQDTLRLFLLDDLLHEEGRDGQEVDLVGDAFGGLHRGDVGVDQDGADALFAQRLQGLGATVVEFAGLADLEGARAEHQDFLYVGVDHMLQLGNEIVEEEFRVHRAAGGLRVELRREERLAGVADTFVGAVVHVDEVRLPALRQASVVHREAVVLRSDEALVRARLAHRLVVGAVAVFQLVGGGAGGDAQQLVAHADAADGFISLQGLADVLHRDLAERRVARAVGDEEAVPVELVEVVVPRDADQLHAALHQAAQDLVLDAAVHQDHLLVALAVADHFLAADDRDLVVQVGVGNGCDRLRAFLHDLAEHRALFAQQLGQRARVDPADAGDLLLLEPFVQALDGVPMAVFLTVVGDDQAPDVDLLGFEGLADAVGIHFHLRDAVITDERIGDAEDLARIGGVRKTLGIAHHRRGEHHFSIARAVVAEAPALHSASIL